MRVFFTLLAHVQYIRLVLVNGNQSDAVHRAHVSSADLSVHYFSGLSQKAPRPQEPDLDCIASQFFDLLGEIRNDLACPFPAGGILGMDNQQGHGQDKSSMNLP